MQIGKWGDSLAVQIPASVVDALQLREGDDVSVLAGPGPSVYILADQSRKAAIAELRALSRPTPDGFRFSREEANAR